MSSFSAIRIEDVPDPVQCALQVELRCAIGDPRERALDVCLQRHELAAEMGLRILRERRRRRAAELAAATTPALTRGRWRGIQLAIDEREIVVLQLAPEDVDRLARGELGPQAA